MITTVAAAHLEFFDSVAGIARAKAEIFEGLEPGGTAILNADHEYLGVLFDRAKASGCRSIVTYGFDDERRLAASTHRGDAGGRAPRSAVTEALRS